MRTATFLVLVFTTLLNQCFAQPIALPKPSGKYYVGVEYLYFTDSSRKELFDNELKKFREMTVKVWYPTDEKPSQTAPYFPNADPAIKYFGFTEIFKEIITNSTLASLVSKRENEYPVLIFNHGWGEHFSQNTILMEELASHGYIVFSIAHHYECKFSFYPDGNIIIIDMKSNRFQKMMQEQQKPESMELINKMMSVSVQNVEEQKKIIVQQGKTLPTLLNETPKYWEQDIKFFISKLKDIKNNDKLLRSKLDLKRIGVLGMSMGGIAATYVCISDNRVKAGINIDGGLVSSILNEKIQTPFMFLNSKRYLSYGALFTGHILPEGYSLSVKNSDHYNFTDHSIYKIPSVNFLLGPIDGAITIDIMNKLVVAFFDKYLKGEKDIDIIKIAKKNTEIEISANMK